MDLAELAEALRSGRIDVAQWEASMRDYLRTQYRAAMELVNGGEEEVTVEDWKYEGIELKKQYGYLGAFALALSLTGLVWMNGRLDARMNLYKDSSWAALSDFERREKEAQGFTEEQNELGVADHCDECLQETAKGRVPIGTLIPIGSRICIVKCKCSIKYFRPGE